ncbi:MAG: AmmeMemoRadiSam system protein B [Candidatus Eisenbacteria bacterium]|nr:AmmeMemoRadiSam system protein B [Candidatus Eisenbacteria bacterium]
MRRTHLGAAAALMLSMILTAGCGAEGGGGDVKPESGQSRGTVRHPVVAGTFYPGDPDRLAADVDAYLDSEDAAGIPGHVYGLIAPHAGYVYSGGVAARAYACIRKRGYDTVVVVAPSHRVAFRGASVYGGDGYETPLGTVPVDRKLAETIMNPSRGIDYDPRAHAAEHSLEVQVPFLQRALVDFSIVPIIMGEQSESAVRLLASSIADAVRDFEGHSVLLVASTDLSHYHSHAAAVELDSHVLRAVEDFDPEGLLGALARGECEACGGGPAAAVMMAARELGADRATVVGYATSGDVTGDKSQVVGYMAAVISGPVAGGGDRAAGSRKEQPRGGGERARGGEGRAFSDEDAVSSAAPYEGLSEKERSALLTLARRSIEAALEGGRPPRLEVSSPALSTECGAFVTLERRGALRGCIGYIRGIKPLGQTVSEMAVQAALHDPRFPPVSRDELDGLTIEISVLSPLLVVNDVSEIVVGKHGLIIQQGARSGLLLPQVATDQGWDRDTFLDHTCLKAGLQPGCWRGDDVTILKFTAEVFGEHQSPQR